MPGWRHADRRVGITRRDGIVGLHAVSLVVEPKGGAKLLLDCAEAASTATASGAVIDKRLEVAFGDVDGDPMRATIGGLTVWLEPEPG